MERFRSGIAGAALCPAAIAMTARTPRVTSSTAMLDYIKRTWLVLTRSNQNLAAAAADPKFPTNGRLPVYVAENEDVHRLERDLRSAMKAPDFEKIQILPLPRDITQIREQGLLYLPKAYSVPAGRCNDPSP